MRKMSNKQRCNKCNHKCVCLYKSYYDNVDIYGERCKHYSPRKGKGNKK